MQVVLFGILQVQLDIHGPAPLRRQVILGGVHGDPVHPGIKRAVAAKPVEFAPGLNERLLRAILGLASFAGHTKTQSVDTVYMSSIELFERLRIRLLRAGDQRRFAACGNCRTL